MGTKFKGLLRQGFKETALAKLVAGNDALMLSAAKRCVVGTEGARSIAAGAVLVICDVRDRIGAEMASAAFGCDVDDLRDRILPGGEPGETNPTPFVSIWVLREVLAEVLTCLGFDVPADWGHALGRAPRAGWFWVLLKREGRGLLIENDLVDIPALPEFPQTDSLGGGNHAACLPDGWTVPANVAARISEETKGLLLRDRELVRQWWEKTSAQVRETELYEETFEPVRRCAEYQELGWTIGAPAQQTAWERGLSGEAATAVLRDCGATPVDACLLDGAQFAEKFGESWFELLPMVNQ
jgi:hypothetical protein